MKNQFLIAVTLGAALLMLACSKGESDLVGTWTAEFTVVEEDVQKWMTDNDETREEIEKQMQLVQAFGMILDLKADGSSTMIFGASAVKVHWTLRENELILTNDNAVPGSEDQIWIVSSDFSTITNPQELTPIKTVLTRN